MSASPAPVELRMGGRVLAEYVWAPVLPPTVSPRPFVHPVRTLAGTEVTELRPDDHRHHLGVSVAVADVGGANFWGGRTFVPGVGSVHLANHGTQRHREWTRRDGLTAAHELRWSAIDGADLVAEHRHVAALPHSDRSWILDVGFTLTNLTEHPLAFASPAANGRPGAGYGGFFWRAARGDRRARVLGPAGEGGDRLHGSRDRWIAVSAEGSDPWTLIFANPAGRDRADPWFVRSDDYVGIGSALAWSEPTHVAPGRDLRRRIITLIADGALGFDEAAALAEDLVADPPPREA